MRLVTPDLTLENPPLHQFFPPAFIMKSGPRKGSD